MNRGYQTTHAQHVLEKTADITSSQCTGIRENPSILRKGVGMAYAHWKSVFVRAYARFRFGRREHVCQHWRSHPGQMELFV